MQPADDSCMAHLHLSSSAEKAQHRHIPLLLDYQCCVENHIHCAQGSQTDLLIGMLRHTASPQSRYCHRRHSSRLTLPTLIRRCRRTGGSEEVTEQQCNITSGIILAHFTGKEIEACVHTATPQRWSRHRRGRPSRPPCPTRPAPSQIAGGTSATCPPQSCGAAAAAQISAAACAM